MNLVSKIKSWPFHLHLSIGVTILLTIFSVVFTSDLIHKQKQMIETNYHEEAVLTLKALKLISAHRLLLRDFAGLSEAEQLVADHKDFLFSMIHLPDGKILMHSEEDKIGKYLIDPKSQSYFAKTDQSITVMESETYLDMASPIISKNYTIGFARVAIDKSPGMKIIADLKMKCVIYTIVAMLIIFSFSYAFTKLISNKLFQLISLARRVESGDRSSRAQIDSHNEVGKLASVFNSMLDSLQREEQQLQESEERFHLAIEVSNDGLWDWNLITNTVYASPRCKEMLGYSGDELMSAEQWKVLIHPDDYEAYAREFSAYLAGEIKTFSHKQRMRHKDGSYRWIFCRGPAHKDASGALVRMIGMNSDITLQLKAEEEKENLYNQLRQAQKMEAVGQLTGGIAHDFNNILTGILGFAEMGLKRKNLDEKTLAAFVQISKFSHWARELVKQMMIFSRGGDPDPKIINVSRIVEESMTMLRPVVTNGIGISASFEEENAMIKIDPVQLQQVIMNLVINARDAMKDGHGEIKLSVNIFEEKNHICSSCGHSFAGRWVELVISDNG